MFQKFMFENSNISASGSNDVSEPQWVLGRLGQKQMGFKIKRERDMAGAGPAKRPRADNSFDERADRIYCKDLRHLYCHNEYQRFVMSCLGAASKDVNVIKKFHISEDEANEVNGKSTQTFFNAWHQTFPGPLKSQPEQKKKHSEGAEFEMDCFGVVNQDTSLSAFLGKLCTNLGSVFVLNTNLDALSEIFLNSGDAIMFEMSEEFRLIPRKLFQLERNMQVLKKFFQVRALGLVIDGRYEDFQSVVQKIDKKKWSMAENPLIFDTPLFIIHRPFINIYSVLDDIQKLFMIQTMIKTELKRELDEKELPYDQKDSRSVLIRKLISSKTSEAVPSGGNAADLSVAPAPTASTGAASESVGHGGKRLCLDGAGSGGC